MANADQTYPYLVIISNDGMMRFPIEVRNANPRRPSDTLHVLYAAQVIDAHGRVSPHGRTLLKRHIGDIAFGSGRTYCVVWNSNFCTYFDTEGDCTETTSLPTGPIEIAPY